MNPVAMTIFNPLKELGIQPATCSPVRNTTDLSYWGLANPLQKALSLHVCSATLLETL